MTFFHDSYGYAYSLLPMLLTVEFDWLWTSLVVTVRSITILSLLLVLVSFETSCNLSHYLTNEFMLLKLKSVSFWDSWSKTLLILVLNLIFLTPGAPVPVEMFFIVLRDVFCY